MIKKVTSLYMMKNTLRVLLFLLIISLSCSEEFMTREPMGSTDETVFYNEKGINSLLTGAYGIIDGGALWEVSWGASIQNWSFGSVASDDAYRGSEPTDSWMVNSIERWEVLTDNTFPSDKWKLCIGMGIYRCNDILRIIELTEGLEPDVEAELRAETRFLRALYTFEAWLVFGDRIPILTLETIAAAGGDASKISNDNPPHAVLNQIIEDLNYAADHLPHRQIQPGRPNKWAAKALAARAYLQELNYAAAKPLLDEIINDGDFSLMTNFMDNYRIAFNNNAESIFEIQANVNDGACCSGNAEMGIGLNFPHGSDIGMCCGFHQPSQNLVNAYRVDANGLPLFDTFNDTDLKNDMDIPSEDPFTPFADEVDPRLDWTVSRRGIPYRDWGINRGRDWIRYQPFGGPYLPASKPFFYQSERYTLSAAAGWMTGVNANNFGYIRLTHVLLWRAECAAYESDLETARTYVNMIRDRADNEIVMGKVFITKLPPSVYPWGPGTDEDDYLVSNAYIDWSQPAANYKIGLYPSFADAKEAMRAVQWELRLEFATEGMRFFDLRRWNNLPADLNSMPIAATLNAFAEADLRIRTFMRDAHFDMGKDEYQPIPQTQIDLQPGVLVQNPGY